MSRDFVPEGWEPISRLAPDITVELKNIVNLVMNGQRLPRRDPYLIDVCLSAIREIEQLRARTTVS